MKAFYNASWVNFQFNLDERDTFEPLIARMEWTMTFKRSMGQVEEEVEVGCPRHRGKIDLTCYACWATLRERTRVRPFVVKQVDRNTVSLIIPLGLVPFMLEKGYPLQPHLHSLFLRLNEIMNSKIPDWADEIVPQTGAELRLLPEHIDAIEKAKRTPRAIIRGIPGAGKTFTAIGLLLCAPSNLRIAWLTHMKTLLEQSGERLENFFKEPIGYIKEGVINTRERITVAMFQSLHRGLKEKHPALIDWVRKVDLLVIDEVHHEPAETFLEVTQHFTNAYLRFGLSATPYREITKENYFLIGGLSHKIIDIKVKPVPIHLVLYDMQGSVKVPEREGLPPAQLYALQYDVAVVNNKIRNRIIAIDAIKNSPALILVTRIPHGEMIKDTVIRVGREMGKDVKVEFIHGEHTSEERWAVIEAFEQGKLDVLIMSDIGKEGVSLKRLETVILAAGQKSKVALIQRVGRGLHPKGKRMVRIVDFLDAGGIPRTHSFKRLKGLKEALPIAKIVKIDWQKVIHP